MTLLGGYGYVVFSSYRHRACMCHGPCCNHAYRERGTGAGTWSVALPCRVRGERIGPCSVTSAEDARHGTRDGWIGFGPGYSTGSLTGCSR